MTVETLERRRDLLPQQPTRIQVLASTLAGSETGVIHLFCKFIKLSSSVYLFSCSHFSCYSFLYYLLLLLYRLSQCVDSIIVTLVAFLLEKTKICFFYGATKICQIFNYSYRMNLLLIICSTLILRNLTMNLVPNFSLVRRMARDLTSIAETSHKPPEIAFTSFSSAK